MTDRVINVRNRFEGAIKESPWNKGEREGDCANKKYNKAETRHAQQ